MKLSIKEILSFGGLADAELVAGRKNIMNLVSSISVLEIAEPQISRWVMADELYITSFYAIRDNIEMQKIVIESLYRAKCCGLVICHMGICMEKIDDSIIELCDELGFPLIAAKPDVSYIEIINPIISKLQSYGNSLDKTISIRSEFLDIMMNENDVTEALKKITFSLQWEVSYYDIDFNCLYSNKNEFTNSAEKKLLKESYSFESLNDDEDYSIIKGIDTESGVKLIRFVKTNSNFFGYIVLNMDKSLTLNEVIKKSNDVCIVCALLFSRKSKIANILSVVKEEYIGDLIVWNFRSDEIAVSKGEELGFNIIDKNNLMVVNINMFQQDKDNDTSTQLNIYIKQWILPNIINLVKTLNPSNFVYFRSDTIIIFLENGKGTVDIKGLGEKIIKLFSATGKSTVSIGISRRFTEFKKIAEAYKEAFSTAILGRDYMSENLTLCYEDVWFFHHMKALRDISETKETSRRILSPLITYDKERGGSLIATLKMLIFNNGDISAVSEKMYLHRNTLLYRKNKIIEILGCDPFVLPYVLNYICALCTMDVGE